MTIAQWQPGTTYAPGALVVPRSSAPVPITALENPELTATTGWTLDSPLSIQTTPVYSTSGQILCAAAASNARAIDDAHIGPVVAGQTVTASCVCRHGTSSSHSSDGAVIIVWYNSSDAEIGQASGTGLPRLSSNDWQQLTVSGVAPANAAYCRIGFECSRSGSDNIAATHFGVGYTVQQAPQAVMYEATQATPGKSGSTEPTWPATGSSVVDNEVTWNGVNIDRIVWQASPLFQTGATEPTWPTDTGGMVHDGTIDWIANSPVIADPNCPHSEVVAIMASKVFAADKDIVRFCATANALDWTTQQDAGYLPTGLQQSNSNDMAVLAPYRGNLTAFNASCFQNWQVDPDPAAMALLDQMEGIGSRHQHAAQAVGNELYYLSQLGVRTVSIAAGADNLKAGDVGMPVDVLVRDSIRISTANDTPVVATYYPSAGQYWLAVRALQPLTLSGDLPDGTVGEAVNYQYTVSGGVLPRVVSIASGALPAGLSISASGLVTGTRTTHGFTTWTLKGVDANGALVLLDDENLTTKPSTLDPATLGSEGGTGGVVASDNLTITKNTDSGGFSIGARVYSADAKTSGKYYFEATVLASASQAAAGMCVGLENASQFNRSQSIHVGTGTLELGGDGTFFQNGAYIGGGGPSFNANGATIGIAVDLSTGKWWWRNASGWNTGGDPATGANPKGTLSAAAMTGGVLPYVIAYASNGSIRANFGNAPFVLGDVPEGFNPGWGLFA